MVQSSAPSHGTFVPWPPLVRYSLPGCRQADTAVLCTDCECISESRTDSCPVCCSHSVVKPCTAAGHNRHENGRPGRDTNQGSSDQMRATEPGRFRRPGKSLSAIIRGRRISCSCRLCPVGSSRKACRVLEPGCPVPNKPVTRIVPCRPEDHSEQERRLIARGVLTPPLKRGPSSLSWPKPPGNVSDEVMEEQGRDYPIVPLADPAPSSPHANSVSKRWTPRC